MIEFLMVPGAPTPVAPFSHATAADGWLFVTGQMPTDPKDDAAPLPEGIEAQTRRVIDNLKLVLAGAGSSLEQVVFARAYLTHFDRDYAAMNAIYQSYFAPGRLPARTCIGVTGHAFGALVEIDLLARTARWAGSAARRGLQYGLDNASKAQRRRERGDGDRGSCATPRRCTRCYTHRNAQCRAPRRMIAWIR